MTYQPDYQYIPPFNKNWLTPIYDLSCSLIGFGRKFRRKVLGAIPLLDGMRIVDVGCGTGVFLEVAAQEYPKCQFFGFDPDEKALSIARKRFHNAQLSVTVEKAYGESLPLADYSVDAVFSSLAFHHMPEEIKPKAIREMFRILKSGGDVVIADFGPGAGSFIPKILHLFENVEYLKGNLEGSLFRYLEAAGFKNVKTAVKHFPAISVIRATK